MAPKSSARLEGAVGGRVLDEKCVLLLYLSHVVVPRTRERRVQKHLEELERDNHASDGALFEVATVPDHPNPGTRGWMDGWIGGEVAFADCWPVAPPLPPLLG